MGRGPAIGVDAERTTRPVEAEAIARRFFTPAEAQAIAALPEGRRQEAFYRIWTQREARLKAQGIGLAGLEAMAHRDSGATDVPTRFPAKGPAGGLSWLRHFSAAPSVLAAVAVMAACPVEREHPTFRSAPVG